MKMIGLRFVETDTDQLSSSASDNFFFNGKFDKKKSFFNKIFFE